MAVEMIALAVTTPFFMPRLPWWALQGCLFFLFTFSYAQARRVYPKWWPRRA